MDGSVSTERPPGYPNGKGIYADYIHLGSIGEPRHADAIRHFASHAPLRNGLYVGAGGMTNLAYISELNPAKAVLADVNALQTVFWEVVIEGLADCSKPAVFSAFMENSQQMVRVAAQRKFRGLDLVNDGSVSHTLSAGQNAPILKAKNLFRGLGPPSWLKTREARDILAPARYDVLHARARAGDIRAETLDVLDGAGCARLGDSFRRAVFPRALAYVSNIRECLRPSEGRDFTGRGGLDATAGNFWSNLTRLLPAREKYVVENDKVWRLRRDAPQKVLAF